MDWGAACACRGDASTSQLKDLSSDGVSTLHTLPTHSVVVSPPIHRTFVMQQWWARTEWAVS